MTYVHRPQESTLSKFPKKLIKLIKHIASSAIHFSHSPIFIPREEKAAKRMQKEATAQEQKKISKQQNPLSKQTDTDEQPAASNWTPVITAATVATPIVSFNVDNLPVTFIPTGAPKVRIPKIEITAPDCPHQPIKTMTQNPNFLGIPQETPRSRKTKKLKLTCHGSFLKCKTGHKVDLGIRHNLWCVESGFEGCNAAAWKSTEIPDSRETCGTCVRVVASMSMGRYFKPDLNTA
ncbi:hypothetical protein BJ875DRAFT_487988 [Amylocarpus encephaloides]|uniref:Uncharacterized protein n=1 Tax=Amylocarpus encephaloides TaxID=45428 RepID=A0A9P8C1G3_9HELO|nr:hypothetical protein BJ875DRAFT_487988 [Amylocarpus encephaloides]